MYGEPRAIRALAASMRERADEVRGEAARLVALLERAAWTGLAADAARDRARRRAGELIAAAARHDSAGDVLDRHARDVETRLELIAGAERVARRLLESGWETGTGLGWEVVRPLLPLPDPGHRDWLDLDLRPAA